MNFSVTLRPRVVETLIGRITRVMAQKTLECSECGEKRVGFLYTREEHGQELAFYQCSNGHVFTVGQ